MAVAVVLLAGIGRWPGERSERGAAWLRSDLAGLGNCVSARGNGPEAEARGRGQQRLGGRRGGGGSWVKRGGCPLRTLTQCSHLGLACTCSITSMCSMCASITTDMAYNVVMLPMCCYYYRYSTTKRCTHHVHTHQPSNLHQQQTITPASSAHHHQHHPSSPMTPSSTLGHPVTQGTTC